MECQSVGVVHRVRDRDAMTPSLLYATGFYLLAFACVLLIGRTN